MASETNYLDKRKIAGIEKTARAKAAASTTAGKILAGAILAAFVVSTVHLMASIRGFGFLGWTLGALSSIATEGAFIWHRYISFPRYENKIQKWAAIFGLSIALLGSLAFFTGDMLLLLGLLPVVQVGPVAVGFMVALLMGAILSESIYELASHSSAYERNRRADALEVLKISDNTRLELDRGELEIMKASADLVLSELFQRANGIRDAIPANIERETKGETVINADDIRDQLFSIPSPINSNGSSPKEKAGGGQ